MTSSIARQPSSDTRARFESKLRIGQVKLKLKLDPAPKPKLLAQASLTVAAMMLSGVSASDFLKVGSRADGVNCVTKGWVASYPFVYTCEKDALRMWELTADGMLRNGENQCFEFPETGEELSANTCDASARRHKWYISNGQIKPQGYYLPNGAWAMRVGQCVDATADPAGKMVLHGCHGGQNQKFANPTFPTINEDIIQVQGPWAAGQNCIDYNYEKGFAYVYSCHGLANQRWSFTAREELRTMGDKCMEYDDKNEVYVRACTGLAKQKWVVLNDGHIQPKGYQAADGSFVSMATKCLDASPSSSKLYLYDCVTDQVNQKFSSDVLRAKSLDLVKVEGTWPEGSNCLDYNYDKGYAYIYSCHGFTNQMWELTSDNQLRSMMDDMCLAIEENELAVFMTKCSASSGLQKWRTTTEGELHPLGFRKTTGEWRNGATKCLSAHLTVGVIGIVDCARLVNQRFHSRAITVVRDYVYATSGAAGSNCVSFDGPRVVVGQCLSLRTHVWEFTVDNELRVDGKCLSLSGSDVKVAPCDASASQKWKPTPTGAISPRQTSDKCLDWSVGASKPALTLATCNSASTGQTFTTNIFQAVTGTVSGLFDKTSALLDAVVADKFLTESVLTKATVVVTEADKALASATTSDAASAKTFLLQFLFQTSVLADYSVPTKVLYQTAQSKEFLLATSVLIAAAESNGKTLEAIKPFVTVFSDQLYEARHEVLWDRVLTENPLYLELSVDGTLDDFDQLGGMLVPVCGLISPLDFKMCALGQFFQLMDQFVAFQYRLSVEGASAIQFSTESMAAEVANTFSSSPLAKSDPLWLRVMSLLLFRAPYIEVLSDDALAHVTSPDSFLPAIVMFAFFGLNNAYTAPLESQIRFLSDQVTTYHFNNLMKMTESRDMDSLNAYMTAPLSAIPYVKPINNYTVSDFPILVNFVAPLVCDDMIRAPLSLCQLETFNVGLQSVLRFERQRRNNIVELEDVLEVDVRKKLDVIEQEKKQYEIITTLQSMANKIGTTINTEMASLKKQISESTTAIRSDVQSTREFLKIMIGDVGSQLQDSLDQSTTLLYNHIGEQATAIRQDIADSSQQLARRLDETGQAILGAVEQSKQELKYQIGAEAEKTRGFITAKSNELKSHISNEMGGLREFVDVKSNQVIGVVREEGRSTRVFMDQKTNQVINVVRDESEKTRTVVRQESQAIQKHIDVKAAEIVGVVREDGAATRQVVVEKAAELKSHITYEANGVKDVVVSAKNEIITKSTTQYNSLTKQARATQTQIASSTASIRKDIRDGTTKLADIAFASCAKTATGKFDFSEASSDFEYSVEDINNYIFTIDPILTQLVKTTEELLDDVYMSVYYKGAKGIFDIFVSVLTLDPVGVFDGADELMGAFASSDYLEEAEKEVKEAGELLHKSVVRIYEVGKQLNVISSKKPMNWDSLKKLTDGSSKPRDIEAFVKEYEKYTTTLRQAELGDLARDMAYVLNVACNGVRDVIASDWPLTESEASETLNSCYDLERLVPQMTSRFSEALNLLDTIRGLLSKNVASEMECAKSEQAKDWAKDWSSRRLLGQRADLAENEPYYAMAYTSLTKIVLDYQLQEAAFQFCKFYEFKNGGVPPPMCGSSSSRTYYTLPQVLQMRSYSPPVYNSVSVRAFLPTKPVFSSVYNRTYPHVNLAQLRVGSAVYVTLPTWDLDWLKKYGWVSASLTVDKMPSMYVESIRLYLPVHANASAGDPSTSSFGATVHVESAKDQYLNLVSRDRKYQLPKQSYTFGATYGVSSCPAANLKTNPYDSLAGCVQGDGSSDMCLRETGATETQDEKQLLPGLFSTWRVTADFSQSDGGALSLLVPKATRNATTSATAAAVGQLLVVADLTIVQITAGKSSTVTADDKNKEVVEKPSATTACCAVDEFRVAKGKCQKCSPGWVGALHGYACVPS